jgi:hypothetical protein
MRLLARIEAGKDTGPGLAREHLLARLDDISAAAAPPPSRHAALIPRRQVGMPFENRTTMYAA